MGRKRPIKALNCRTREVTQYPSVKAAGEAGFTTSSISECLCGRRQTHKGHLWEYDNDLNNPKELDLTLTPTEAAQILKVSRNIVKNVLKYSRALQGVTKAELLRREIEPLVMQYGVSIEECAKKFCMSPKTSCKILGWDND